MSVEDDDFFDFFDDNTLAAVDALVDAHQKSKQVRLLKNCCAALDGPCTLGRVKRYQAANLHFR